MHAIIEFTKTIIEHYGYHGLFWLTFSEQFIFPLPADEFIALGTSFGMNLGTIIPLVLIATMLGALTGYFLGKYLGHPVATWLFGKKRMDQGENFIKKWGIWGVVIAGITPIPFKIMTWMAGIFEMSLWKFVLGTAIGRFPRYLLVAYAGSLFFESKFYATTEMSAVILGVLQGVTEFLPISSSGHLVITEHFLKLPLETAEMESFDILLHAGSLMAILIYFWRDWLQVLKELFNFLRTGKIQKDSWLAMLAIGTVPAIIGGLMFGDIIGGSTLRGLKSIGMLFIFTSAFLMYAEWRGKKNQEEKMDLKKATLIGCYQALALMPGLSRAGMTMGGGILSGLKREVAARFSFMLGGIAIFAANIYTIFSVGDAAVFPELKFILIGVITTFVVSLAAIAWLLKFLKNHTLLGFSIYLLLAGASILSFL